MNRISERGCWTRFPAALVAIVSDGFVWAAFNRLEALRQLLARGGLPENVGATVRIIPAKVVRCRLATEVAIETLGVHEELADDVCRVP
jgi:hypothetical protein